MGIIREPSDVDFFVDPKPLTEKERKIISDFLRPTKRKGKVKTPQKRAHIPTVSTHMRHSPVILSSSNAWFLDF